MGPVTHLDSGPPQGGLSPIIKACNQVVFHSLPNPKAPNLHYNTSSFPGGKRGEQVEEDWLQES